MSFFNPSLKQKKERLQQQIFLIRLKAHHTKNHRQAANLALKAELLQNKIRELWRKELLG